MLELMDIRLRIGDADILRGISLKLEDKKMYAVTGRTAAGNRLWLRLSWAYNDPSGSVLLDGQDITG